MQGWRKRMEDSHISDISIGNDGLIHIFGVFDGHGGKEVAQYVKKHFSTEFINSSSYKSGDIKNALIENFLRMDNLMVESSGKLELKKFAKLAKEEEEQVNQKEKNRQFDIYRQLLDPKSSEDCDIAMMTGCTASVCLIDEGNKKLYFANAGDSRAVLCKKGVAYPMSIDHKPDLDIEKNRIYKADGWVSEGRVKGINNILIYI
jgi:protein phosphatase 1G